MPRGTAYLPAALLGLGCLFLLRTGQQRALALREPLASLPMTMAGFSGRDLTISAQEQRVAGMSSYVLRTFGRDSLTMFSVYAGYYAAQTQGKSIHSPKNCLPGAGWEPVTSGTRPVATSQGDFAVNRYVVAKGSVRALVYYWYQGRGRVAANEYAVKWDLLRDKAVARRSEETLVRIVVPVTGSMNGADSLAGSVATELIPQLFRLLPAAQGTD
jgi:EpsI family protein